VDFIENPFFCSAPILTFAGIHLRASLHLLSSSRRLPGSA
jgi:hypothetical protein